MNYFLPVVQEIHGLFNTITKNFNQCGHRHCGACYSSLHVLPTGKLKARLHFMNFIGSYHSLTFKVLIKNRENNALHYISCPADNSHELSSLIFSEKKKKIEKKKKYYGNHNYNRWLFFLEIFWENKAWPFIGFCQADNSFSASII